MKIAKQRTFAEYLVGGSIIISVTIASIPSIPLLVSGNIYTFLFGASLVALAIVSELIAAFTAFKFFAILEHVVKGKLDLIGRTIIAAAVAIMAVIGNGALVHMGLEAANHSISQLAVNQINEANRLDQEALTAQTHINAIRSGHEGAVSSAFMSDPQSLAILRQQDQASIARYTNERDHNPERANALRLSAASIQQRPEYLLMLAVLVLKFAELTVVFLASPISFYRNDGLNNEQREKLGMKRRGRPSKRHLQLVANS